MEASLQVDSIYVEYDFVEQALGQAVRVPTLHTGMHLSSGS